MNMSDEELISMLTAMQAEAYLQKIPLASNIISKVKERINYLSRENSRLRECERAIKALNYLDEIRKD